MGERERERRTKKENEREKGGVHVGQTLTERRGLRVHTPLKREEKERKKAIQRRSR